MSESANELLVSLLRAEVESARADADAVRGSVRFRLGDVLLQALPLSLSSFRVIPKALALLITYRRNLRAPANSVAGAAAGSMSGVLPVAVLQCQQVEFNPSASSASVVHNDVWLTNDVASLVTRLDAAPINQLVLHAISEPVARRLARLQWQGCRIVCCAAGADPLVQYAQCFADESEAGGAR